MQFVTTLVSFPVVSLLTMSIAAKNTWQSRRRQERERIPLLAFETTNL